MEEKQHILIVDDTPTNIKIVNDLLKNDYKISAATNGKKALEIASFDKKPDLILLDIMMPEMDGYEVCIELKKSQKTKDIPVIFITAKNAIDDIIKGFELGAVDYITKPFNPSELLVRVNNHIELKTSKEIILKQIIEYKELLHVICHDLSNPISFIMGVIDLAQDNPSIYQKLQHRMKNAMSNGIDLIDMVRKMRALEENKMAFKLEKLHLKSTLNESIYMINYKLDKKNITLNTHVADNLYITAEKTSFVNSIINNLLTNAIKFSYPDSKIDIYAAINGEEVSISVKDYGMGMPEKLINDLFEMNKPTSREGTDGEIGTGFGMPLAKKFLTVYGGNIKVISKEKETSPDDYGTEVRLFLKGFTE